MTRIFFLYFSVILTVFFFTSCDKEKQTSRKIEGNWELKSYKITYQDGISEYGSCSGNLEIVSTSKADWTNSFKMNISFVFPSQTGQQSKIGYMRIREKGGYMDVSLVDQQDQEVGFEDHRIMVLTSTDLQIEYLGEDGSLNNLTFRK